ncbi:17205_t:CDS:10, partial [Entrophospora sp. SA101]
AFAKANSEAEKLLWERLVNDLKKIDLTQLPYNHPLYSGIFDIESSPISDLPDSLCNVFEENTKKKFCIDNNEALLQTCKEYIQEVSIGLEEPPLETCDPPFMSREVESYNEAIIGSITVINEGSYVSEVLAPLFNIALRDLPTKQNMKNLLVQLAKILMDFARDYLKQFIKKGVLTNLPSIFSINIAGDDLRIYSMHMENVLLIALYRLSNVVKQPVHTIYPEIKSTLICSHKPTKQNQLSISSKKKKQDQILLDSGEKVKQDQILLVNNNGEKKKQDQILLVNNNGEKKKQDQILLSNSENKQQQQKKKEVIVEEKKIDPIVTKIIENLRAKNLKEIKSTLLNDENKPVVGSVEDALKFKMEFYNHLNSFELETLDKLLRNHLVETLEPDGQLNNVLSIIETYDIESQKSQKEFEKLKYFELLKSKNYDEAYNYLYEKISDVDSIELINKMNELIISKDIATNEEIIRYILMGYFESHKFDEPLNLWNKLREMKVIKLNSLLYSEMIRGFSMKNHLQPVEKLWKEMKSDKVEPNLQIYSSLMEINFKLGKKLIKGLLMNRKQEEALRILNTSIYNILFDHIDTRAIIIELFNDMKALNVQMNQVTYTTLMNYLIRINDKESLNNLMKFDNSNRSGGRSNYNNLRNKNRNIINYSLMIKRDIKNNDLEKLNLTLSEMKSENISLTLVIYNSIFDYYIKYNHFDDLLDDALKIYSDYKKSGLKNFDNLEFEKTVKKLELKNL